MTASHPPESIRVALVKWSEGDNNVRSVERMCDRRNRSIKSPPPISTICANGIDERDPLIAVIERTRAA
jgi:hypothetical protein